MKRNFGDFCLSQSHTKSPPLTRSSVLLESIQDTPSSRSSSYSCNSPFNYFGNETKTTNSDDNTFKSFCFGEQVQPFANDNFSSRISKENLQFKLDSSNSMSPTTSPSSQQVSLSPLNRHHTKKRRLNFDKLPNRPIIANNYQKTASIPEGLASATLSPSLESASPLSSSSLFPISHNSKIVNSEIRNDHKTNNDSHQYHHHVNSERCEHNGNIDAHIGICSSDNHHNMNDDMNVTMTSNRALEESTKSNNLTPSILTSGGNACQIPLNISANGVNGTRRNHVSTWNLNDAQHVQHLRYLEECLLKSNNKSVVLNNCSLSLLNKISQRHNQQSNIHHKELQVNNNNNPDKCLEISFTPLPLSNTMIVNDNHNNGHNHNSIAKEQQQQQQQDDVEMENSCQKLHVNDIIQSSSSSSSQYVHLHVRTATGFTVPLKMKKNSTVEEVKNEICRSRGVNVRNQRLIYKGKCLADENSLIHCGIDRDGEKLQFLTTLHGGGSASS